MRRLFLLTAGLLVALLATGCGPQARKNRHVKAAEAFFAEGKYEAAEIEYRNALRAVPLDPTSIARLGIIYFEQGRQLRAYSFLSKAAELQPDNLDVKIKLISLQLAGRKMTEARDNALAVLARRPQDREAPLLLAETATQVKDLADLRSQLLALPPPAPEGAPVLVALGALELRQRKIDDAEQFFRRALAKDAKSADAHAAMALVYLAKKDDAKAEAAMKSAAELSPPRSTKRIQYAQYRLQRDTKAGRLALAEIVKQAPDFLPAWMAMAQAAMADNQPEEALECLAKVTTKESAHPEALLMTGRARVAKGDLDKAIGDFERAVGQFPTLPQAHLELGQALLNKGDLARATVSLNQAVTLAPSFPEAITALASLQIRKGELATAISALQKLVLQRPDILQARSLLADALRQQGKLDDALAVYASTEKAFPALPTVPHLRGMILLQQRKFAEARQAFNRAVEIGPSYFAPVEQLATLDIREKKPDSARARIEAYIARVPKSAEGYVLLARVLLAQKDEKLAEIALQRAITAQPESTAAYLVLARLQLGRQESAQAISNLQAALTKEPGNAEALTLLSAIYQQQNNHAAARDTFEKLIAINPRFAVAYNNLAFLYSEHFNQIDKALEMAQRARELAPLDGNVADTLGWILFKKKQFSAALALLQEAAEKLPGAAEVQYHLGMAHYMLGEQGAARAALKNALQLQPDFPGNADARTRLVLLGDDAATLGVDARVALEKAVSERKDDPIALLRLAQVYEKEGTLDKAQATYEAAVTASPQNVNGMLGLSRILAARRDVSKALELARAARKLAPDDPAVAHHLGRLAFQSGQHSWAFSLLQEALRRSPDAPELLFDSALAAFAVGRSSESSANLRKALELAPGFPRAAQAKSMLTMIGASANPGDAATAAAIAAELKSNPDSAPALMASGAVSEFKRDAANAQKTYEKVLTLYPDLLLAKRQLAILAAQSKEAASPKALEHATKAREALPDDPELAKAFGILTYRQGNGARAITLLQEAVAKRKDDAEALYYLGLARRRQNDRNGARQALQAALDAQLAGEQATDARQVLAELK